MPLRIVTGDPLLTQVDLLAFGHNARGRTELGKLETRLMHRYTAAFAMYTRAARQGKRKPGTWWLWSESRPGLAFMTIRDSSVGATRLRYVQSALIMLGREYSLHGIQSIAIAPLGSAYERGEINQLVTQWFSNLSLPVTLYADYVPGVLGEDVS